jgi:hypothetical protein
MPPELAFHFVDKVGTGAVPPAHIGRGETPASCSSKTPDDLLFRKSSAIPALVFVFGQSNLQFDLSLKGNPRTAPRILDRSGRVE